MGCYESTIVDSRVVKKSFVIQDDFTKAEISEIKRRAMDLHQCIIVCETADIEYIKSRVPAEMSAGAYKLNHNGIERLDKETF